MTKVHINSPAHEVLIDHDGADLAYVVDKAQKLWDDTKPPDGGTGPAVGFIAGHSHQPGSQLLGQGHPNDVTARDRQPDPSGAPPPARSLWSGLNT